MAKRFGKKIQIDLNPLHYNIALLGESGIGKTTLAKEACEKLVGDEGYIHFDIGREDGASAINGIVSEKIEDWDKLDEVVEDIIENKTEDYPDLQVVILDTLDELILLAEAEAIRQYNRKNSGNRVETINEAYGGFMRGQDKATELILNTIWRLKQVGVSSIIIGHVKRTDITDPVTQETYSKLTSDVSQRYFNAFKNKMHFVGLAYIDREIVKEKTGKKNIVTKKEETINKAVKESRVISFRDDTYSVDSKSRFAEIVDHIPFDSEEFIKALKDAIMAEQAKSGESTKDAEKRMKKAQEKADAEAKEASKKAKEEAKRAKEFDVEANEELIDRIKEAFPNADTDDKAQVKEIMKENGFNSFKNPENIPTEALEKIVHVLGC